MGTQESLTQEIKCDLDCKTLVGNFRGRGWLANRELGEGGLSPQTRSFVQKQGRKSTESQQEMGFQRLNGTRKGNITSRQARWLCR